MSIITCNVSRFRSLCYCFLGLHEHYRKRILFQKRVLLNESTRDSCRTDDHCELISSPSPCNYCFVVVHVFYMKTCSFRGAEPRSMTEGLFCSNKVSTSLECSVLPRTCNCFINSPYPKSHRVWSLQNAILYTSQRFLDKSTTRQTWSVLLDPAYSPLSPKECQRRILYASADCFAVTYLHHPIYESWSLKNLRESRLTSLFTSIEPLHYPCRHPQWCWKTFRTRRTVKYTH